MRRRNAGLLCRGTNDGDVERARRSAVHPIGVWDGPHQICFSVWPSVFFLPLVRGRLAYTGPRTGEMLEDTGWLYRQYGEPQSVTA